MNKAQLLKRIYKTQIKKYLPDLGIIIIFMLLNGAATAAVAWLLDPAIKKIFIDKDENLIFVIPLMIILAFAIKGVSLYLAKSTMISVGEEIKKKLQFDMTKTLINADTQYIDKKHSGGFISNLTYDVTHITDLLSSAILSLFKDSLTLVGLLFVMFLQNWKLALISIIMVPLAGVTSKILGKRINKVTTEAQEKSSFLTSYLVELFKNHKLIKIFQKENYEEIKANNKLENLKDKNKKIAIVFVRMSPIMEILTGFMIAALIFYAGILISKNELDINNFFSFLAAMMLAYQPVRALSTLNMVINRGLSAANRILPIIDQKKEIIDEGDSINIQIKSGEIEFDNVSFSYEPNEIVLKSINLLFKGGEMTSLVGLSGSGKSTILNLIPRFYNINNGKILIDNQSINSVKVKSLRDQISFVSQDTTLFDDTIKNNIKYGNNKTTDEEMMAAAKLSYCDEFIEKLPLKYETMIGEDGVRLSGGEKQRLSIARAMMKKSPIILLDEATSSLDSETEHKIQNAIEILTKNKTTIVIAHRLSTILNSNNIYVIDSGKIIDNGKHEQLMANSELYKNFYEKQIKKS